LPAGRISLSPNKLRVQHLRSFAVKQIIAKLLADYPRGFASVTIILTHHDGTNTSTVINQTVLYQHSIENFLRFNPSAEELIALFNATN
jgi:hypothetical protein